MARLGFLPQIAHGRDGSGNYARVEGPYQDGQVIDDDEVNAELDDIATALTGSLPRNGEAGMSGDLPMGGNQVANMGVAVALTDAARADQVQKGALLWGGVAGGTADALTLTLSPAPSAYTLGQPIRFMAQLNNTGPATLNVNSLGAGLIIWPNGNQLEADEIAAGSVIQVIVSNAGTPVFQLQTVANKPSDGDFTAPGTGAVPVTQAYLNQKELYPQMFGAAGDNSTNDATALANWYAACLSARLPGYIPYGRYVSNSQLAWNLGSTTDIATRGVTIRGAGPRQSIIAFANGTTSPNLKIHASGATTAAFYSRFEGIGVEGNTNGTVMQIGETSFSDAFNSCVFDFICNNNSSGSSAIAQDINFIAACFVRSVNNVAGTSNGTATRIRQAVYSDLSIQAGNAARGIHITGGSTYGNVFHAPLLEVLDTGLTIDVATAFLNLFLGGSIAQVDYCYDISNGNIELPNTWDSPVYGTINTDKFNLTGSPSHSLTLIRPSQTALSATPSVPSSTVALTNVYGETIDVYITGGTVSAVVVGGATVHVLSNVNVTLNPGETIALTYSVLPGWTWRRRR